MPSSDTSPIASAELLAIGAELLVGETRDTNSGDLARALTDLGVEVLRMTQLPDDLDDHRRGHHAQRSARVDLVITSGGLGPDARRPDARGASRPRSASNRRSTPTWRPGCGTSGRGAASPFSTVNLKQAWLIPSASALANPNGTAPGWWVEAAAGVIVALPGPPRELLPMWRDEALPRLPRPWSRRWTAPSSPCA